MASKQRTTTALSDRPEVRVKLKPSRTVPKPAAVRGSSARKAVTTVSKSQAFEVSPVAERLASIAEKIRLARLLSEKCELAEARLTYRRAHEEAKELREHRLIMEALSGLLRLAGEALDHQEVERIEAELDEWMQAFPSEVPALAWYCKGAIARHYEKNSLAQRWFHRYLKEVRQLPDRAFLPGEPSRAECVARAWVMLAATSHRRGHVKRARFICQSLLPTVEEASFRTIPGVLYLLLGNMDERTRQFERALFWYRKAHSAFLAEHNWYYHLSVLYGYARIARQQRNYAQAYWYLDLMERACSGPEFGLLRREVAAERGRLEQETVDLRIDSRKGEIQTRDSGPISLKRQYVLLQILESLAEAHAVEGTDEARGLSKAELIEKVWGERYRPEAHDNKLYYNINRLRKLIEPEMREPRYLENWKEGYRLAPGLKIHWTRGA
jgi:DNA-binding winged helix-turn-helix (wHTH) protein